MRFGIIGTNFIGDWLLEAAREVPDFTLAAVYSRTRSKGEAFAEKYGVKKVFTSIAALAACPDIDAVYIASPTALHCAHALEMLSHGKHVLCEKAIAMNSRELSAMLDCAAQNGVALMEAMRNIHTPAVDIVRRQLPRIGTVRRVSLVFNQYSSRYDKFKAGIVENAFRPELSGGALLDIGVYCVQMLTALFGAPQSIAAKAVKLPGSIDGQGAILAQYDSFLAEISYSKISDAASPSVIQGEMGSLLLPDMANPKYITFQPRSGPAETIVCDTRDNNLSHQLRHFIRFASGVDGANLTFYQQCSVESMKIMDEARRQQGIVYAADTAT